MMRLSWRMLALLALLAVPGLATATTTLTGITVHSTDTSGSFAEGQVWNTKGLDAQFNLYVALGAFPGEAFVNSGNGAAVSIGIPLGPGVHTFTLVAAPGSVIPASFGINLFFSGNEANPGISAFGPVNGPGFTANAGTTVNLIDTFVNLVPGAGTLAFADEGITVTVTGFSWFAPGILAADRVHGFDSAPDGILDFVGQLTLTVTATSAALPVSIDIKPGGLPNSINLHSAGVVPVAILSDLAFDATGVDPASVTLAGAKVSLIGKADKSSCHVEDVNGDALPDLVCHVTTAQFMIEPGDSVAVLEAETFGGQRIRGEDSIRIVP